MGRNLLQDENRGRVVHPRGKWLDSDLAHLSQFSEDEDACWSVKTLRPVPDRRCDKGSVDAARQLDIVSLVLERDLQAGISERLASKQEN